jgi:hypothetical protein
VVVVGRHGRLTEVGLQTAGGKQLSGRACAVTALCYEYRFITLTCSALLACHVSCMSYTVCQDLCWVISCVWWYLWACLIVVLLAVIAKLVGHVHGVIGLHAVFMLFGVLSLLD